MAQMREFGLFGATIPAEYGASTRRHDLRPHHRGAGLRLDDPVGVLNTHMIALEPDQAVRHRGAAGLLAALPGDGEVRAAFSLSEPDAGSDTQALRAKAVPDGDEYVVNGTKMGHQRRAGGIVALAARTPRGITCFIVEKEPGPRSRGSASAATSTSSATRASRRWR